MANIIKFNEYLTEGLLKGKSKEDIERIKNSMPIDAYLKNLADKEVPIDFIKNEIKEFDDKLKIKKYKDLYTDVVLNSLFYALYFSYNEMMYEDGDYSYHIFLLNTNLYEYLTIETRAYVLDCGFNVVSNMVDNDEFKKVLTIKTKEIINNISNVFIKASLSIYINDYNIFTELLKTNNNVLRNKNDYEYNLLDIAYLSDNNKAFIDLLISPIGFKLNDMQSSTTSNLFKDKKLLQLIVDNFDKLLMVDIKTYRELIVALKPYVNIN